jgi:hypothetical protein
MFVCMCAVETSISRDSHHGVGSASFIRIPSSFPSCACSCSIQTPAVTYVLSSFFIDAVIV